MNEGIIVINKPSGITSHDVVDVVRRKLNMRRVGHAGTLDPMATGVLIILVGPATKLFDKFVGFDKAYDATLRLGEKTTTADTQGTIIEKKPFETIDLQQMEKAFQDFVGVTQQVPPMVSAVKHKGKRLYQLARQGKEVERVARTIRIDRIQVLNFSPPEVKFHMECSKGTYVRKLAEDVGDLLGCGACISQIERTKVGPFTINEAARLEEIDESHIRPWQI